MKNKLLFVLTTVTLPFFLCQAARAGSWDWAKPYKDPAKRVNTLIIVGNYVKPRLMADLIQIETKQPILVLPAKAEGKVHFVPLRDDTLTIPEEDVQSFIKYLNPDKILVLGDKRYVPQRYIAKIDPKQTVIRVENENWEKIASLVTSILNLTYLERRYRAKEAKIESGELYRPEGADDSMAPVRKTDDETADDDLIVDETVIVDDKTSDSNSKNGDSPDLKITSEPKLIDDTKVVPK